MEKPETSIKINILNTTKLIFNDEQRKVFVFSSEVDNEEIISLSGEFYNFFKRALTHTSLNEYLAKFLENSNESIQNDMFSLLTELQEKNILKVIFFEDIKVAPLINDPRFVCTFFDQLDETQFQALTCNPGDIISGDPCQVCMPDPVKWGPAPNCAPNNPTCEPIITGSWQTVGYSC